MSHNINHYTYDLNCDKKKVQAELDHYAAMEDWQEGCSGLGSPIRWLDVTLDDYDKAIEYIEKHDRGWYDQLAVKYKSYPRPSKQSKAVSELVTRFEAARASKEKIVKDGSIKNRTSEYIGCPKCGSKLKASLLHGEFCPLCRADLRSPTTLDRLNKAQARIDEAQKKLEEQRKKESKPVVKWLVKIEYHT
jgi:hypothetical protein